MTPETPQQMLAVLDEYRNALIADTLAGKAMHAALAEAIRRWELHDGLVRAGENAFVVLAALHLSVRGEIAADIKEAIADSVNELKNVLLAQAQKGQSQ